MRCSFDKQSCTALAFYQTRRGQTSGTAEATAEQRASLLGRVKSSALRALTTSWRSPTTSAFRSSQGDATPPHHALQPGAGAQAVRLRDSANVSKATAGTMINQDSVIRTHMPNLAGR